jgi:hypothetical protein
MSLTTSSSLRLEPFSGRDNRELVKWLREFEYHADANNWDDAAKLRKFPTYLRDYGLLWYDQNVKRNANAPTTWEALKKLITNDLLSTDHRSYLHSEIRCRKQAPNESVYNYILAKRDLCLELNDSMSDRDMIQYLFQGMKPDIAKMLRAHGPKNVNQFIDLAKQIERGIDEFDNNGNSNYRPVTELSTLMRDFGTMLRDATLNLKRANNERRNNASFLQNRNRPYNELGSYRQNNHIRGHDYNSIKTYDRSNSPSWTRDSRGNHNVGDRRFQSPNWNQDNSVRNNNDQRTSQRGNLGVKQNTTSKRVNFDLNKNMSQSRTTDGRNICYSCQQPGHHSRNCPFRRSANVENGHSNASFLVAQAISPLVDNYNNRLMFISVKLNGHIIKALVDTGSEITMISDKLAEELGLRITKYKGKQVTGVNAQPVEITGQTQINVVVFDPDGERSIPITAMTIRNFHMNFLLGYDFHYASKSVIDIYNNNIVFNSLAVQNPMRMKTPISNNISKMHSIENIEVPPNGMQIVKCVPSSKRTIPDIECFAKSNPSLLSKRKIFVKDQNIKVKDGIAKVPVINLSDNRVAISAGSIVSDYELPIICAAANSQGFDIKSNPRITKIVEEDRVAYETFCKILDLAKGVP